MDTSQSGTVFLTGSLPIKRNLNAKARHILDNSVLSALWKQFEEGFLLAMSKLYRTLTSTPTSTLGINWNTDCEPSTGAWPHERACGWMGRNPCIHNLVENLHHKGWVFKTKCWWNQFILMELSWSVDLGKYCKWLTLTLRWPERARESKMEEAIMARKLCSTSI